MDDIVGYKKPPKNKQFKKGESGNPKGRPPNKLLHQIVEQVLNETVSLNINGEKVVMTKKEAMIQQLAQGAVSGKSAPTKNLIYLMRTLNEIWPV